MLTPLTAIQDSDPYPYYAGLTRERPFAFDADLDAWVAASADTVSMCLDSDGLLARPPQAPVPEGLLNTCAGQVYGHLVRMRDDPLQHALKARVTAAFATLAIDETRHLAHALCRGLLDEGAGYGDIMFAVPSRVVANLCGFTTEEGVEANRLIADFVQCLPATASRLQQEKASVAAEQLLSRFDVQVSRGADGPLLGALLRAACDEQWPDRAALIANGVGFLSQSYDATAGLIGNALVTLSRHGGWPAESAAQVAYVDEVARYDAPIQNTRRFAGRDLVFEGHALARGDQLLLLLAAANRDPSANAHPHRFVPGREGARCFTFSRGRHRCPGQQLAVAVTCGVLDAVLEKASGEPPVFSEITYIRSGNARIPML